jgi:hypothetical protein
MTLITIDFETTYDQDYSLSRMSEVDYILDPRFETIMCSVKVGAAPSEVHVGHKRIEKRFAEIGWANSALLSHNVRFDGAILAWRFGYVPKLYLDTLSMARATSHWVIGRSSLAKVAEYLGLPAKGDEVIRAKGKRLADFTRDELQAYAAYCVRDNELCYAIFQKMRRCFRASEIALIDLVARMFILPQVRLNPAVLERNYQEVLAEKARLMAEVEAIPKARLSSNPQFAALLREHGVEVPMKTSPTTGEEIPALAKGDWQFKELCQDDELPAFVQALLAARVAVKSTLEETRSRNLLLLSKAAWPGQGAGWAPIALKYSGARTHRLSGDGGVNWQNLRRGSLIRQAVEAPEGYRIVHRDASQIEARMLAWMARCDYLLKAFAEGRDVYSEFATIVYRETVSKEDKLKRFVGKTAILGLGYGCGAERFRQMLFIGNGGISVKVDEARAQDIVYAYRDTFPEITALWSYVEQLLRSVVAINTKSRRPVYTSNWARSLYDHIPVETDFDAFVLPNDLRISYPDIREDELDQLRNSYGIVYSDPHTKTPKKIYGAKGVENISQALSRIIVTDIAARVYARTGYRPFLSTHDSLDYCVPEPEAEAIDAELARQFALVPAWGQGLPLASEGGWGISLAAAERGANA